MVRDRHTERNLGRGTLSVWQRLRVDLRGSTRMPYIDLRDNQEGIAVIKTVRKKFAGATKREIEKKPISRALYSAEWATLQMKY